MAHETVRTEVDKARDAGMALCLLCFLIGASTRQRWLEWAAMAVLVVDMIAPIVFRPFAVVWFGLSAIIGAVTSKILLSGLFFMIVTPVGLLRRMMGKDPMQRKRWRRDRATVLVVRDHLYTAQDIKRPY